MRFKPLMALTGLAVLTGCSPHPADNASVVASDSLTSSDGTTLSAPPVDSLHSNYFDPEQIAEETRTLAACPDVERDGDVLRLKRAGKVVAVLADKPENAWQLTHCLTAPAAKGKTVKYFVFDDAEQIEISRSSLIVDETGAAIGWVPSTIQIYEGPLIAGGFIGEDAGAFVILDWSQPQHVRYQFETPCYPQAWHSDSELIAKCGWVYQDAKATTIRKVGPSTWRAVPDGKPVKAKAEEPFSAEVVDNLADSGFTQVAS